jgi:type II secretory ATPase GspE/PulE/Tfp pilus assembly ATPase PilB-like protein
VIAASLTGHLVFSTMHTNSAVESIVRLLDFGLDAFNFSDALLGVVGQRLVRRLCHCKKAYTAAPQEIDSLAHEYCRETGHRPGDVAARWRSRYGAGDGSLTLFAPVGCETCDHTGYKGRLGVYELLLSTPAIKTAVQARASAGDVLRLAVEGGMTTLEQDAIEKILQGHLDYKQVLASCR